MTWPNIFDLTTNSKIVLINLRKPEKTGKMSNVTRVSKVSKTYHV